MTRLNRRRITASIIVVLIIGSIVGVLLFRSHQPTANTTAGDNDPPLLEPSKSSTDMVDKSEGYIANNSPVDPFDMDHPALAKLNPILLDAIQRAARDAAVDGVKMYVTAGWRSAAYQQKLLDEATKSYGSLREARKFVSTPEDSHHVSGDAVDISPTDANSWLSQYGSKYGLCQTYANEMWHFELATSAGGTCPAPKTDASNS